MSLEQVQQGSLVKETVSKTICKDCQILLVFWRVSFHLFQHTRDHTVQTLHIPAVSVKKRFLVMKTNHGCACELFEQPVEEA